MVNPTVKKYKFNIIYINYIKIIIINLKYFYYFFELINKIKSYTILESYIAFAINFPRNLNFVLSFARWDTLVLHEIGIGKSPCGALTYPVSVGLELPCQRSRSARCNS